MRKVIFTLDIGNYAPALTALTRPFLERYARKCSADLKVITERVFEERLPIVYEKFQIFDLGRQYDWITYIDADALIHPDFVDLTEFLPKDTVLHYGCDFAPNRFKSDAYFRRSGRQIGSCNWFTVCHNDCLDLWNNQGETSFEQDVANIYPTTNERNFGMEPSHLIDDYILSRNIARYGLKATTVGDQLSRFGHGSEQYLWHMYATSLENKVSNCIKQLYLWGLWKEAGLPAPPEPK